MEKDEKNLTLNQETMDILVANIIPTTKYFESRFDHMQYQIDEIKDWQKSFEVKVDNRFDEMTKYVDNRFDEMKKYVDERFEQVDKRFEQVDKRFEQVNESIVKLTFKIEELTKAQEVTVRDYIIERDRFYDKKFNNLRMFNIATISLIAGVILKMMGIIHI